jgi:hypothetical protein
MEADPYTPSNIYVEALNRFRLTQTKYTELKGKDKKNKFHRSDLTKANKANKRAEIRFIEMFLEACQIYIDKHGLEENDTVFKSLEEFFDAIGNSGESKELVQLVLGKRSNSLCLDHIIRSKAVPTELKTVLQSSDFFRGLRKKAMKTKGGAEDAAGGVLAIEMFGLGEKEVTNLHMEAHDIYAQRSILWLLNEKPKLKDRQMDNNKNLDKMFERLQKELGLDDDKKGSSVQRRYELNDDNKRKLFAAARKQRESARLYWSVAYILLLQEKTSVEPSVTLPLTDTDKEVANAIYKMLNASWFRAVSQPAENEGGDFGLYSAAPPESSGADFRF